MPVAGAASDGRHPVRWAARHALPGVPYQPRQFHYPRQAARPIHEADRHAEEPLNKRVRKSRPIERAVGGRPGPVAEVARGYRGAVRSAPTDDGRPPPAASGLKPHGRLTAISDGPGRAEAKGGCRPSWGR